MAASAPSAAEQAGQAPCSDSEALPRRRSGCPSRRPSWNRNGSNATRSGSSRCRCAPCTASRRRAPSTPSRSARTALHPGLIRAYVEIKKAAALANTAAGALDERRGHAIVRAADEVIDGHWLEHFPLDAFQAGAGTSTNMNVNEVLANRALELLGYGRGDYGQLHPNDHVNRSQSTNDTMPTAIRVASLRLLGSLLAAVDGLVAAFEAKAAEWAEVRKAGRTHLHDATPMTLGQEFAGYAANVRRAAERVRAIEAPLAEVPLGGTAIGTGINTAPGFAGLAVGQLAAITGLPLREAPDRIASQQSLGDFVALSGALRGLAVELSKIANDLRLLSSGPHTGLDEIELPALQPGSSIMPGKVNPVVAEMLNMACFHVIGHDVAITMAGEAGQLELNVMLPYVAYALLDSLDVLAHAVATFDTKTVRLLEAHPDRCAWFAERTVGAATALNDELGFQGAAEVAQEAIRSGRTVAEVMAERRAESGKMQRDGGAPAWRRLDVQLTADQHRPLVHAEQAEAAALPARQRRRTTPPARCRCRRPSGRSCPVAARGRPSPGWRRRACARCSTPPARCGRPAFRPRAAAVRRPCLRRGTWPRSRTSPTSRRPSGATPPGAPARRGRRDGDRAGGSRCAGRRVRPPPGRRGGGCPALRLRPNGRRAIPA